jgi:hypothetical protein
MPLLILSPRYTPDSIALRNAALQSGWQVDRLMNYRPLEYPARQQFAFYGEALFTTIVAEALEYALLEVPSDWLPNLPAQYLKRSVKHMTLAEARTLIAPAFIKPAESKSFAARIYAAGADLPAADVEADNFPVLVAEPVTWDSEFRCFVLEREVATYSIYKRNGDASDDIAPATSAEIGDMLAFCAAFLSDVAVSVPPAFGLDVGYIAGKGWAVIEANPAWASGVYQCDPAKVLLVLERACVPLADLSEADHHWLIQRFSEEDG